MAFRFDLDSSGGRKSSGGFKRGGGWAPSKPPVSRNPLNPWSTVNPAPAPAPVYSPPPYQAPYVSPAQGTPYADPGYYNPGIASGGGGQAAAPAAPPKPPPPPPKPKRIGAGGFASKYKGNDKGLALVDSTFQDQSSSFAKVLKEYMADYTRQNGDLVRDEATAQKGIASNMKNGLTSQAEDFFARGLGNSGMFGSEQTEAEQRYKDQSTNVGQALTSSKNDLNFRKAKFEGENGANGSNVQAARREAYNRLALKENLV